MYDIKNLNIWKKDSQSRLKMTRSGMKVISKDNVNYPVYLGREFMNSDLTALNLSVRSYNGLRRAGWKTVEDIINHIASNQDLSKIRNLGKTSIQEIMTKLLDYNMSLLSSGEIEIYDKHFEALNSSEDVSKNAKKCLAKDWDNIEIHRFCKISIGNNVNVELMKDIPDGEYSRLKRIYSDAGISIKEPHVGELSFTVNKELIDVEIEKLELSTRPYNALKRMGISKITDIPPSYELRKIRNLGDNSIYEIIDKVFEYHYRKMDESKRYEYLLTVKHGYESRFEDSK